MKGQQSTQAKKLVRWQPLGYQNLVFYSETFVFFDSLFLTFPNKVTIIHKWPLGSMLQLLAQHIDISWEAIKSEFSVSCSTPTCSRSLLTRRVTSYQPHLSDAPGQVLHNIKYILLTVQCTPNWHQSIYFHRGDLSRWTLPLLLNLLKPIFVLLYSWC